MAIADHNRTRNAPSACNPINRLTNLLRTLVLAAFAALAAPVQADMGQLISALTSQVGVTEEQATGGAASIFDMARSSLSESDFGTLAGAVPGLAALADQAPEGAAKKSSGFLSGAMQQLGGTALLADRFQGLGMSPDIVHKFVPVVLDYVEKEGGDVAMQLLKSAL